MTTKPTTTIIFDMDGTLCSTYNVPNWLNELRERRTTPYELAEPMWDMEELRSLIIDCQARNIEIKIVSWSSKESTTDFDTRIRKAKHEWLNKYRFPFDSCRITPYGYPKEYLRNKNTQNILIDDNAEVRSSFCRFENCFAIDPTTVNIIEWLEELIKDA